MLTFLQVIFYCVIIVNKDVVTDMRWYQDINQQLQLHDVFITAVYLNHRTAFNDSHIFFRF